MEHRQGGSDRAGIQGTSTSGSNMGHKYFLLFCFFTGLILASRNCATQESEPDIHVIVNMVQLNVAVTDNKGNYVTGLRPQDFAITEDAIAEKLATFGEGDEPTRLVESASDNVKAPSAPPRVMPDLPSAVPASDLGS